MSELSFQGAKRLLDSGKIPPNFILLHGENGFLAREILLHIRNRLACAGEYDYLEWDEGAEDEGVVNSLVTFPLGYDRRLVVIHNPRQGVLEFCLRIDNPSLVAVIHFNRKVKQAEKIYQAALKKGWVIECAALSRNDLVRWLYEEAQRRRKGLSTSAVEYLKFLCGDNMGQLRQEIEKASLYLEPESDVINVEVLEKVGCRTTVRSVFELVDAVSERKKGLVKEVLSDLLDQGCTPVFLVSLLSRHFLQLLEISCLRKEGLEQKAPEFTGIHPYVIKKLMRQMELYSEEEIERVLELLLQLDRDIKQGRGNPVWLLEAALGRICGSLN